MSFRHMMMEKLKMNVAYKIANNSTLVNEVASIVLDELDYLEIASDLNISSSDIANEIDHSDVISEITGHLDMDEIGRAVAENCDMDEITSRVIANLPSDFMDDIAVQAAEEIIEEMKQ